MKNNQLPLSEDFIAYKDHNLSVLRGAILVGKTINTDLDTSWVLSQVKRLANDIAIHDDENGSDTLLSSFRNSGFRGASDYYNYANSDIESVLKERVGIPITLAVLLMSVADELGINNSGINFPAHFLVSIGNRLVDPFSMTFVADDTLRHWLERSRVPRNEALRRARPCQMVVRMLNNLKALAVAQSDFIKALDFSGYQLLVADNVFSLYLERAELWTRLEVPTMAVKELEHASDIAPDPETSTALKKQIEDLTQSVTKLH